MNPVTLSFVLLVVTFVVAGLGLRSLLAGYDQRAGVLRRARPAEAEAGQRGSLSQTLDARLRQTGWGRAVATRLAGAGLEYTVWQFARATSAVALVALFVVDLVAPSWLAVIMAGGGVRACLGWVERKRNQRREAFVAQLPELARVLSNGVSAGLSMTASLNLAVGELEDPASTELGLVLGEVRIGQSLPDALAHLSERMPSRELGVLVSTLVIQQRAGGDAVRALHDMSETLETRKDLIREVRTLMAGSVFSGWVVAGLGVATIFLINLGQPGSLDKMTSSPAGVVALVVAGTLYTVGLLIIRRITRVDT